jgi:regulatory protein YycI of two-component signal transduction system YycFG
MYQKIFQLAQTIDNNIELVEHHEQYTIVINNKEKVISWHPDFYERLEQQKNQAN